MACHRGDRAVAPVLRDRVTIDLCGIGDAARQAAQVRGTTLSVFARLALIDAIGPRPNACSAPIFSQPQAPGPNVKLTLRLRPTDAEALVKAAGILCLPYGAYVAKLVNRTPLPAPVAERHADRAALLASTDQLAVLVTDLHAFMRMLAKLDRSGMEPYRERMRTLDVRILRHIDLASKLIANSD